MIVLTGGAGFIGSCILAELNRLGRREILVVDTLKGRDDKRPNLAGKVYAGFMDKHEFLEKIRNNKLDAAVHWFIHMGACSSTTLADEQYYRENNYEYSIHCAQWALAHAARFVYASSAATYGDGDQGYSDDPKLTRRLKPLNFYGEYKHRFDLWVMDHGYDKQVVGLKFFNVFGPNEYHKGDMRSVVCKAYDRVVKEGKMALFKSYRPDYGDGEQKRDFIYVKDAVDIVMYFVMHSGVNGIYNVGTGKARSWNDLARALFTAAGKPVNISYMDMPESLRPRYQYFTEADTRRLRASGYRKEFTPLEEGIKDYCRYLAGHKIW